MSTEISFVVIFHKVRSCNLQPYVAVLIKLQSPISPKAINAYKTRIIILYTEILTRKVDLQSYFMSSEYRVKKYANPHHNFGTK